MSSYIITRKTQEALQGRQSFISQNEDDDLTERYYTSRDDEKDETEKELELLSEEELAELDSIEEMERLEDDDLIPNDTIDDLPF